jgi:hypothetical protein
VNHHHTASGLTRGTEALGRRGSELREAQAYQLVGELAPEAEQVLTHQKGWAGLAGDPPIAAQPIAQAQAHDISFWNRRANRQTLAATDDSSYAEDFFSPVNHPADIPPAAGYGLGQGYTQTPAAATHPAPFDQFDPGIVSGADASTEQSGNAGFLEPPSRR